MPDEQNDARPTLMMLSHCVPNATGNIDRVRAWQLLRLMSQTHRVHLACLMDRPVRLAQWRAVHALADRLVLDRRTPWRALAARCVRAWHGPAGDELAIGDALRASVDPWLHEQPYDALLCTHPLMWRGVRDIGADLRICDMRLPASLTHLRQLRECRVRQRWRHQQQTRLFSAAERIAAAQFDLITVGHPSIEHPFMTARCETVVLPDAVDLAHLPHPQMSEAAAGAARRRPELLVYVDHANGGGRAVSRRFVRDVWPQVRQAVPGVTLTCVDASVRGITSPAPTGPRVVVCPESDPAAARLPMLQAMTCGGPLVADRRAAQDIGARPGEHLLGVDAPDDWARACIRLLRDAAQRGRIARGGRDFVERRGRIESAGAALRQRLMTTDPRPIVAPERLRRAA